MFDTEIIIDFDKWCPTCKHKKKAANDYPCSDCLDHPVSYNSERPVLYLEEVAKNS